MNDADDPMASAGPGRTWFDLITCNVADPSSAADALMRNNDLRVAEDEDDGRWIALVTSAGDRRVGLQRADRREVDATQPSRMILDHDLVAEVSVIDAARSAAFWSAAIGLDVVESAVAELHERTGRRCLRLIEVDAATIVGAPRSLVHLDLATSMTDFDAEVDRLVGLGAVTTGPRHDASYGLHQAMIDHDGLVFCVNAYRDGGASR